MYTWSDKYGFCVIEYKVLTTFSALKIQLFGFCIVKEYNYCKKSTGS